MIEITSSEFYPCEHGKNAHQMIVKNLKQSQKGAGRHKCAVCAFHIGYMDARAGKVLPKVGIETCNHGNTAPTSMLDSLPESQASHHRHKCCVCAYFEGYYFEETAADLINTNTLKKTLSEIVTGNRLTEVPIPTNNAKKGLRGTPLSRKKLSSKFNATKPDKVIGLLGELLVIEFEKNRLIAAGFPKLAEKVEHISLVQGDGAGYDIRSFSNAKVPRFIEVKTTKSNAMAPFYITSNEIAFSKQNASNYFVYRVFDANRKINASPKVFIQPGYVENWCHLDPIQFRAQPM